MPEELHVKVVGQRPGIMAKTVKVTGRPPPSDVTTKTVGDAMQGADEVTAVATGDEFHFWRAAGSLLKRISESNLALWILGFCATKAQGLKADTALQPTQHATLTVGTGNAAVTYEAVIDGISGEDLSVVQSQNLSGLHDPEISVSGQKITVIPGMVSVIVSGCPDPTYDGEYIGGSYLSSVAYVRNDGYMIRWNDQTIGRWFFSPDGNTVGYQTAAALIAAQPFPADQLFYSGATPVPAIDVAGVYSSSDVVASFVNAGTELVIAHGHGSSPVILQSETHLSLT